MYAKSSNSSQPAPLHLVKPRRVHDFAVNWRKSCGEVKLLRGVNQGDPLSPLLFNLVIDELVAELEDSPCGVNGKRSKGIVPGFRRRFGARGHCHWRPTTTHKASRGDPETRWSPHEPGEISFNGAPSRQEVEKWYVNSEATFVVDGRQRHNFSLEMRQSIWRVLVGANGRKESYRTQLARLDRTIRCFVRALVKMPGDAADAFLYSDVARGGLGIPHFSSLVPLMKQKRLESLLNSSDALVLISTMEGEWLKDQRYWSSPPKIRGQKVRFSEEIYRRWGELLGQMVDGARMVQQIKKEPRHSYLGVFMYRQDSSLAAITSKPLRWGVEPLKPI